MIETDLGTGMNIILVLVVKEGLFKDVYSDNMNERRSWAISVQHRKHAKALKQEESCRNLGKEIGKCGLGVVRARCRVWRCRWGLFYLQD